MSNQHPSTDWRQRQRKGIRNDLGISKAFVLSIDLFIRISATAFSRIANRQENDVDQSSSCNKINTPLSDTCTNGLEDKPNVVPHDVDVNVSIDEGDFDQENGNNTNQTA